MVTKEERIEWFNGDFVRGHLQRALSEGRAEWESAVVSGVESNCLYTRVESPIEMVFIGCWTILSHVRGCMDDVGIALQREVEACGRKYRLDVAMTNISTDFTEEAKRLGLRVPKIAVELDGHEFHERTKEQVAYRDARDRALQADGWTVFHVSGSVINRDPMKAAWDVYSDARKVFSDFNNSLYGIRLAAEAAAADKASSPERGTT